MPIVKKKKVENETTAKHRELFPSFRNDFFINPFFTPRLAGFNENILDRGISEPLVNISETNKEFKFEISAPGLKKEDFNIDVDNGVLSISSEKEEEKTESDKNYRKKEFSYNSFCRTFQLPENVDEKSISAKYENGMLEVTIPKKEVTTENPKKQIRVS